MHLCSPRKTLDNFVIYTKPSTKDLKCLIEMHGFYKDGVTPEGNF